MKNVAFYLGLGLLFTHEMDAMPNHEWRVLPIVNGLTESSGELVFLVAHIPLFALTIAFVASMNPKTRHLAQQLASAFLILHAGLHFAFSGHANYEFSSVLSRTLVYGGALCGIGYFLITVIDNEPKST